MDDYIKRDDAIMLLQLSPTIESAENEIRGYPTADVRENVRGEWIYQNPLFVDTIMCSVCGYNLPSDEFKTNFCPNCGADMRERGE